MSGLVVLGLNKMMHWMQAFLQVGCGTARKLTEVFGRCHVEGGYGREGMKDESDAMGAQLSGRNIVAVDGCGVLGLRIQGRGDQKTA